jgi:UDPglucose 6-dehydrogenase
MKICVFGLWHLGCVTAACVAERFPTIALDLDSQRVLDLQACRPPIFEPGLEELIRAGQSSGRLRFTNDRREALSDADLVWVTLDTPVNDEDSADLDFVECQVASLFPHLRDGATVLISSQLPVGSTRRFEMAYQRDYPARDARFAYSPENLRLGKALGVFRAPGRIVVGIRSAEDRDYLRRFLEPFCDNLVWMSVESAEMTKHALNAFLANSIVFINEIAALCEEVGADAKQVEEGLKTDERIGRRAYLGAGGPFAGGTLARDVTFLTRRAEQLGIPVPLLHSITRSNDLHKNWVRIKLESVCGPLADKTIAVLGLTYKPGTDTLRRSAAVELCGWLAERHAKINAFDPAVRQLPAQLAGRVVLCDSAIAAIKGSDAVVIATEWPLFRELQAGDFTANMSTPTILDANRFLEASLEPTAPLRYIAVGTPRELV